MKFVVGYLVVLTTYFLLHITNDTSMMEIKMLSGGVRVGRSVGGKARGNQTKKMEHFINT